QRVEENLPRGAVRLTSSPAGHKVAEADELAEAVVLVTGRVEDGLPLMRAVALREEPVQLDGEVTREAWEPLLSDVVCSVRAPGEGRAHANHAHHLLDEGSATQEPSGFR